jgi:gliding motility-associated-like protein
MLGDSTLVGRGVAMLAKTFYVTPSTSDFTYQYALFLANPTHDSTQQPFFNVYVLDENGNTIPACGSYNVAAGYGTVGFDTIASLSDCNETMPVYYKNWSLVNVPLKNYIGQCVTVEFVSSDCEPGGHFGYAYVDCSCSPFGVISSSPNICGGDSISLSAPPGAGSYAWTGPPGGILTDTALQTIWVDLPGTYTVIAIPVTGETCADTLTITVGSTTSPEPTPSFTTTTACAGQAIHFINTSTDTATASFYWDFYNIGIYNDTNIVNPTWVYTAPGTYTVNLKEIYNGCGKDTLITVTVDSSVLGGFTITGSECINNPLIFTNTSRGSTSYKWNFGDPASGTSDTTSSFNPPSFTYTAVGTYTVTLIAKNSGPCPDTAMEIIVINSYPRPIITGLDSVCPSYSDTLKVVGGTSSYTYSWSTGATTSSISVASASTATITVTATNGECSHDTTFVVYRVLPVSTITASKDSVCSGSSDTLSASGGSSYRWSSGSTSSSIIVNPAIPTTYTLFATKGTCTDSSTIKIGILKTIDESLSISKDSICPGDTVRLTSAPVGTIALSYSWNTGGTYDTINVHPNVTTTYTATITGKCNSTTKTITALVVPLPIPVITGTSWKCHFIKDTLTVSSSTSPTTYLWSNGSTKSTYYTGEIDADSTISVIAINALGCSDTTSFFITSRAVPDITINKPAPACSGQPVEIIAKATGTGPFTYTWEPGGETTDSISVPSPADSSTVTYTATVTNGCPASKIVEVTAEFPVLYTIGTQTVTIEADTAILWASGNSKPPYHWQDSLETPCLDPPACDTVRVTPTVTTTYTVTGVDKAGCEVTGYVTVVVDVPCLNFTVPNVFTPDFAGTNGHDNEFYIKTENLNGWSIIIFDRWGKEMYSNSTNQFQYWNGTNKDGTNAPDGVYYYVITGVCQNTTYKKEGFVQLIR